MTEMETVNLRVESEAKDQVAALAGYLQETEEGSSLSGAARELIYVGLGVEMSDAQISYEGPLGLISRPFAGANFSGDTQTVGTRLPQRTIGRLEGAFGKKKHPAAQEALKLGLTFVQIDEIQVRGALNGPRPFADINVEGQIEDERALESLRKIRAALPND